MRTRSALLGAAAVAGAGLVYANCETRWFEIKHVTVPILPAGQPDIRVLQLADLHYLPSQGEKTRWLESLGQLQPDLVVDTGDNVSSSASIPALLDVLGRAGLLEVPGVFVGGSNDYYQPILKNPAQYLFRNRKISFDLPPLPTAELFGGFESHGWVNLNNRRALVTLKTGQTIDFVGTDDAHHEKEDFPARESSFPEADAGAPRSGRLSSEATPRGRRNHHAKPVAHIGVTHAPYQRVLQQFHDDGCSLVIAGHTHGGQLRIPGFGAIVTNCDLDRRRAEGLHGWPGAKPTSPLGQGSMWLYVSAGAGTSPYAPFRFACRPSATLLTLTPASAK